GTLPRDGADGDAQHQAGSVGPMTVRALAVSAAGRRVLTAIAEVQERREPLVGLEDDRAAVAPVPAVGTAPGHARLPTEADAAAPAVAALDAGLDLGAAPSSLAEMSNSRG